MVAIYEGSALKHLRRSGAEGPGPVDGKDSGTSRPAASDPPPADSRSSSPGSAGPTITCGFCGRDFVEDRSQATCQACPLKKGCGLMRCPHCGYENAKEPGWIKRIKEWIG